MDGHSYLLELGGGIGAEFPILGKQAVATIEITIMGVLGDHTYGVGGGLIISATIDFKVVSVSVCCEARQLFLWTECTPNPSHPSISATTKWGLTQLSIAVEVHIFWVIGID